MDARKSINVGLILILLISGCVPNTKNANNRFQNSDELRAGCSTSAPEACTNSSLCMLLGYPRLRNEAQNRGLACVAPTSGGATIADGITSPTSSELCTDKLVKSCTADQICQKATSFKKGVLEWRNKSLQAVKEAKSRNLNCGIPQSKKVSKNPKPVEKNVCRKSLQACNDAQLCELSTTEKAGKRDWNQYYFLEHVSEAKRRGLDCNVTELTNKIAPVIDDEGFTSVQQLLAENETGNSEFQTISIISQRCAGLFGALAKFIPQEMAEERKELFNISMSFLRMAMKAKKKQYGQTKGSEAISNEIDRKFIADVDVYYKRMELNQIRSGSIFDQFIKTERKICSRLVS